MATSGQGGTAAELENLLGRGPLTAEELATAEAEFFYPLSSEEFYAKVAAERLAELRQVVIEAATAAGENPPAWLDSAEDDLSPEQLAEIEVWLAARLAAPEADATPTSDSEGLSVPGPNDTTEAVNGQQAQS